MLLLGFFITLLFKMGHFSNSGPRCEQVLKLKKLILAHAIFSSNIKKKVLKLLPSPQGKVKFEIPQSYENQIETAPK